MKALEVVDGTVNVTFGSKMENDVRVKIHERLAHAYSISNVRPHETIIGVGAYCRQVFGVRRIGKLVNITA